MKVRSDIERLIPVRIRPHVVGCSVDSDGYWVWGDSWFYDPSSGSATIHADTITELRRMLSRAVVRCPMFLCSEG